MSEFIWILRDSITGEPYTSTNEKPEDIESPIEWNFSLAYWCQEKKITKEKQYVE
jgi:hypothetical protein